LGVWLVRLAVWCYFLWLLLVLLNEFNSRLGSRFISAEDFCALLAFVSLTLSKAEARRRASYSILFSSLCFIATAVVSFAAEVFELLTRADPGLRAASAAFAAVSSRFFCLRKAAELFVVSVLNKRESCL
jgi:hypothetical protein